MAYALGIDIGTTYTAAAVWRDGRATTVPLGDRAHSVPSALFLREDGVMLVGEAANRRGTTDPNRVAREFKRRLGDEAPLLLGDAQMSAQQLTGYLLRWVVEKVTEREGEQPAHVTLTCPATWGDYRRQLMTEAAGTAKLTDVGLLPEPIAAAVYYASQERLEPDSLVAVYDLGGGTFDATVVRKTSGGFDIHGTAGGDETIGGTDFDQVVMDHIAITIGVGWSTFDTEDPTVLAGLAQVRTHAVGAKEALSTDTDATVPVILPDLTRDVRLTRAEFESAIRIPILRTVDTLAQTLTSAGVEPADLHAVLLVGGSSRIPLVSRLIAQELGVPVAVDAHPKYAVCLGAAISAGSRLPASQSTPKPFGATHPGTTPPPAPATTGTATAADLVAGVPVTRALATGAATTAGTTTAPTAPQPGAPQPGAPQPGAPQPGAPQPGAPQPGAPQPGAPHPGGPAASHPGGLPVPQPGVPVWGPPATTPGPTVWTPKGTLPAAPASAPTTSSWDGPTVDNPTIAAPTTAAGPTTLGPTTAGPTAFAPTTAGPTAFGPTTAGPTAFGPTSAGPTSFGSAGVEPTLVEPAGAITPGASGPAGEGEELLAPEPYGAPAVHVDLASVGLERPLDVLLSPVPDYDQPLPELTGRDEPLTVTHTGNAGRGRLIVVAVLVGAVILVVSASALGLAARSGGQDTPPPPPPAPTGAGPTAGAPGTQAATLRAQPVPGRRGDVMRAVTALPGGGLVAVGGSTSETVPRAWRFTGGKWAQVPGPGGRSTLRGEMTGVAGGGDGFVAVGWVAPRNGPDDAAARKPAIWTSKDGKVWSRRPTSAIGGSGSLGELFDVAPRSGGGFVATGVDWGTDRDSGDGTVLTSADGKRWQRAATKGLDGPGPTTLRRLLRVGAQTIAVGTRLDGTASRSVMWTSPDAGTWSVAGRLDAPGLALPSAWGLTRTPDGGLLVAGFSVPPNGPPTPVVWTGRTPSALEAHPVTGAAAQIYGLTAAGGRITAIGAQKLGDNTIAAAWTVQLP